LHHRFGFFVLLQAIFDGSIRAVGLIIHLEVIHLKVDAHSVLGREGLVHFRPDLHVAENELAEADVLGRDGNYIVGENQGTRAELIILKTWYRKPRIDDAHVSAVYVLDDDVQLVESRRKRHGLLIDSRGTGRLLEERGRKVGAERVFKRLNDTPAQARDSREKVHRSRIHAVFLQEVQLGNRNLYGDGY